MLLSGLPVLQSNVKMGKRTQQYNPQPCKICRVHERDLLLEKRIKIYIKSLNSRKYAVLLEVPEVFCLDPPISDLSILSFSRSSLSLSGSRSDSDCVVASVGMIIQYFFEV